MRQTSLVIRLSLALAGIVALAVVTMVTSYWISNSSDKDAYAINLAGSLRMQTYRMAYLAQQDKSGELLKQAQNQTLNSWNNPILSRLAQNQEVLAQSYQAAKTHWHTVESKLMEGAFEPAQLQPLLDEQIRRLEAFVSRVQEHAEDNARQLRLVQVVALFAILSLASLVVYWLHRRVQRPLSEMTRMAERVSQGKYDRRLQVRQNDELGILAGTFNQMSHAIARMHQNMEEEINTKTQALQRSNTTLQFLYDTAKAIIEQEPGKLDYQPIINQLIQLVEADDIELCLITDTGNTPYVQIKPEQSVHDVCVIRNCSDCLSGDLLKDAQQTGLSDPVFRYSFPLVREQTHYGVLVCRMGEGCTLELWQQQLLQSVADQLALSLSLQAQEEQGRRLSLAQERTVIARELHDSLAQALSYLKIQVTRLDRALDKNDRTTLTDVSRELREGLGSAYQQLRELLTTFRLKVDGPGFLGALQTSVKQLSAQSDLDIQLDYRIESLPLTPNEEIHLLQIVREAAQNAIHHSEGKTLVIQLLQNEQKQVSVSIEDDGKGMPEDPGKLNHYGLAIMQERSKNLDGQLSIANRPQGGVGVYFAFTPNCLKQRQVFVRQA